MQDEVVRLSMIGRILRRRWQLLAVLAAVGALLGGAASLLVSPGYQSTSTVLVEGADGEAELATEARIATSTVVLDRTAAGLPWAVTGSKLRGSVSAETLNGNLIAITGTAETPARAQQLTERVTEEYVPFSNQLASLTTADATEALKTLEQRLTELSGNVAELQGPGPGPGRGPGRLRATLADVLTELEEIRARGAAAFGRSDLVVMEPARPSSPAPPTMLQLIYGSALAFLLLGVFAHIVAARSDKRVWSATEIGAALGTPVVSNTDVPHGPSAAPRGWRARALRLLRGDPPWDAPQLPVSGSAHDREIRYRRALARLRTAPDVTLRLLVLVVRDDAAAQRAVAQLAVAAGRDSAPASVVTSAAGLTRIVEDTKNIADAHKVALTICPSSDQVPPTQRTVLHVADVSATRPTVPDRERVSGAVVLLTAGTRTGWELVGLAEACADAGHQLLGAIVAQPTRSAGTTQAQAPAVSPNGKAMAGSAG